MYLFGARGPAVATWPDSRNQEAWGEGSRAEGQAGLAAGASCLVLPHFNCHVKWRSTEALSAQGEELGPAARLVCPFRCTGFWNPRHENRTSHFAHLFPQDSPSRDAAEVATCLRPRVPGCWRNRNSDGFPLDEASSAADWHPEDQVTIL